MCPLVKEFQKHPEEFETTVCVTGQHREMLDQVLRIFEVTPDYDLNIMKQGQDLYDVTARVLTGMRDVFKECKLDVVLVHGDTTTSTAAASPGSTPAPTTPWPKPPSSSRSSKNARAAKSPASKKSPSAQAGSPPPSCVNWRSLWRRISMGNI